MIASVRAKPSHMRPWSWPRSSGWRPTASIVLPKMMPTPMPGPMAPNPVASPSTMVFAAVLTSPLTAMVLLVFGVDCSTDVDRGKSGEDVGLQGGDQGRLQQVERDPHREADDVHGEGGVPERGRHQCADAQEHGDHEVAGQHVEEQPEAERHQPYDLSQHLDHGDQAKQAG